MRPFLASGVRPDAPHRARHAGAALRSFITSGANTPQEESMLMELGSRLVTPLLNILDLDFR